MMTTRQKLAMMLRKSHFTDSQVGAKLGISRVAANRLINRGIRAQQSLRQDMADLLNDH